MPAVDAFDYNTKSLDSPASKAFAITPTDGVEITYVTRGLFTGSGGSITLILEDDTSAVTLINVPSGIVLPLRVKQVNSTSTTATGLIGLY